MATGVAARCLRDVRCRQCTGKRLSRAIWSSFNKERMSHLCGSTVAGPTARRDNVLASKCEYPPFRYPPFKCTLSLGLRERVLRINGALAGFVLKSSGGSPSEGHNPPCGSPRKFASQRVLRGLCGGLFEGSAGSPVGLCGALRGVCGIFRG